MKPENSTTYVVPEFLQNLVSMCISDEVCLLCGGERAVVGIFVPNDTEAWGAPKGKNRLIRYCLCSKCYERPDKAERAEKIIRSELSGGGVINE